MKISKILTVASLAAVLALSAGGLMAQDNNNNDNNNNRQGRRGGQGGPGGGNFDPAQMQQRMMDRVREELGFTSDADWNAVQPLVQKVMDARREVGVGGMGMFGRGRGGPGGPGGGGNRGGMFGQTSPEQQALQNAIDANAPAAQIKELLAKYKAVRKEKQAKLAAAQADLRKVLSVKQEAQATLMGLVE
jgi:hypothetical protein